MTEEQYIKRMKQHEAIFDKLWQKIVTDTNTFIAKKDNRLRTSSANQIERFVDNLCLSGAWIVDRLDGYYGTINHSTYNKSLTKKIRKVLGYTK